MKKNLKKSFHLISQILFWIFGLFFILGGLGYVSKSFWAGFLMLLLGISLLPPLWNFLSKKKSKSTRYIRIFGIIILFIVTVAITPTSPSTESQTVHSVTTQSTKKATPQNTENKDEKLSSINFVDNKYIVNGSGLANTTYALAISNGTDIKTVTDSKGNFKQEISGFTPVFGSIELKRDTNGAWFGGNETFDAQYFILNSQNSSLSKTLPKPVILGVGGNSKYEMSGYYLSNKNLLLKAGNDTIASTKVDASGRYKFDNIALSTNYIQVAIYEKVSTGWFSSKEEKLSDNKYLDNERHQVLTSLPIIIKESISTESIPFASRSVENSSIEKGQTSVTQIGSNGERKNTYKVTYRGNDEINRELISSEVTKQPVENITTVGTYVYVAPQVSSPKTSITSNGRTGAICHDGSRSSATGRGACSHHGGVAQWLY